MTPSTFDHLFQKYVLPFWSILFIIVSLAALGGWGYVMFK